MNADRILIAGIGNIFLGDDAFGVEVAQKLAQRPWPENVRVVDFGIRSLDLIYALMDGCDIAILVDAVPWGEAPGTLFVIEPERLEAPESAADDMAAGNLMMEAHGMDPVKVLRAVSALGGKVKRILVVGCEPSPCESPDEMQMEMTPLVKQAVDEAATLVETIVQRLRSDGYFAKENQNPQTPFQGDNNHVSSYQTP